MNLKLIPLLVLLAQTAAAQLPNGLYAAFDTTMGGFTCRLDVAEAPLTCANFVGLIEGTQSWIDPQDGRIRNTPFYDGLTFHRIVENFIIQSGDPLGTGSGGPGYRFPDQISTNLLHHKAGILSMANYGPNSNGSQFFITLKETPELDGRHAVFGEVVDGMNAISAIGASADPQTQIVINSVRTLRIGTVARSFNPTAHPLPVPRPLPIAHSNRVFFVSDSKANEQIIFSSTNLTEWTESQKRYTAERMDWTLSTATNRPREYFKGVEVFYPMAVTAFSDIAGKTLTFTRGTEVLIFSPTADGGTCSYLGSPDTLYEWADLTSEPYFGRIYFRPLSYLPVQFSLLPDGTCTGYQWQGSWVNLGSFKLTITPP